MDHKFDSLEYMLRWDTSLGMIYDLRNEIGSEFREVFHRAIICGAGSADDCCSPTLKVMESWGKEKPQVTSLDALCPACR
jgi:fructoselysine-6-P-deglycase FrlB-like protein